MSGKMDKEDKLKYTYILKCQCVRGAPIQNHTQGF